MWESTWLVILQLFNQSYQSCDINKFTLEILIDPGEAVDHKIHLNLGVSKPTHQIGSGL